jgi:hypothetical protein
VTQETLVVGALVQSLVDAALHGNELPRALLVLLPQENIITIIHSRFLHMEHEGDQDQVAREGCSTGVCKNGMNYV